MNLIVGKITWGPDSSTSGSISIYLPGTNLALPATPASTQSTDVKFDQSTFDTISFAPGWTNSVTPEIDEIRFGATYADVVPTGAPDTTAPTPNPMTWATPPAAASSTSITMTATTASDPSGVQYFFDCTAAAGHDSAWQDSPTYTDTGLTAATSYTYQVKARDKAATPNETVYSSTASATTQNSSGSGTAVIHEPFASATGTLAGKNAGTGLTGTWNSGGMNVTAGSLSYGGLITAGNHVVTMATGGNGEVSPGTTLSAAGLLANGAELWFSALVRSVTGQDQRTYLTLGTGAADGYDRIGDNDTGSGVGVQLNNGQAYAHGWLGYSIGSGAVRGGAAAVADGVQLVVGKIKWGANGTANDTISIYLPGTDLALPATAASTATMLVDQSTYTTISFAGMNSTAIPEIDEIRFGTSYAAVVPVGAAYITAFGVPGYTGVINQAAKTITLTVPYGTNLATIAPTFTLSTGSCNQTSGSPPSPTFATSNPAHYIVTDGSVVNDYAVSVTVTPASTACDILTFGLPNNAGFIDQVAKTIMLTVPVSPGVADLAPTYTLSPSATCSPLSGTTLNFTNPQTYTVTAQDGTTQKIYTVRAQTYQAWTYSGSLFILTTPDGANIATGTPETDFPLLVKFNSNNFPFGQAAADGSDIRFSTTAGAALSYQIEQWDAVAGTAAVWVKIPGIAANARQEIKMYWGKPGSVSESDGTKVFNAANGFASVFHLNESLTDVVGNTTPTNDGTTLTTGMIGKGRNFTPGSGIEVGSSITTLPTGTNPHTTEAWFRAGAAGNTLVYWGQFQGAGFINLQFGNPPHISVDTFYGGGNVEGSPLALSQWYHVAYTYSGGQTRMYVNGVLDASAGNGGLNMPTPAQMHIGAGWGGYNYVGDMDEVRVSKVARSANWVKMEYENQKPAADFGGQPGPGRLDLLRLARVGDDERRRHHHPHRPGRRRPESLLDP